MTDSDWKKLVSFPPPLPTPKPKPKNHQKPPKKDEQQNADFLIAVQDQNIPVHKCILIARSNYFRSCLMSSAAMTEAQQNRLVIPSDASRYLKGLDEPLLS